MCLCTQVLVVSVDAMVSYGYMGLTMHSRNQHGILLLLAEEKAIFIAS